MDGHLVLFDVSSEVEERDGTASLGVGVASGVVTAWSEIVGVGVLVGRGPIETSPDTANHGVGDIVTARLGKDGNLLLDDGYVAIHSVVVQTELPGSLSLCTGNGMCSRIGVACVQLVEDALRNDNELVRTFSHPHAGRSILHELLHAGKKLAEAHLAPLDDTKELVERGCPLDGRLVSHSRWRGIVGVHALGRGDGLVNSKLTLEEDAIVHALEALLKVELASTGLLKLGEFELGTNLMLVHVHHNSLLSVSDTVRLGEGSTSTGHLQVPDEGGHLTTLETIGPSWRAHDPMPAVLLAGIVLNVGSDVGGSHLGVGLYHVLNRSGLRATLVDDEWAWLSKEGHDVGHANESVGSQVILDELGPLLSCEVRSGRTPAECSTCGQRHIVNVTGSWGRCNTKRMKWCICRNYVSQITVQHRTQSYSSLLFVRIHVEHEEGARRHIRYGGGGGGAEIAKSVESESLTVELMHVSSQLPLYLSHTISIYLTSTHLLFLYL